jgi:hypothetical protein
MAQDRVTAIDLEALNSGAANVRVSAIDLEALNKGNAQTRVTAVDIEVLVPLHPNIYFGHKRNRRPEFRGAERSHVRDRRFAALTRQPVTFFPFTYLLLTGL